MEPHVPGCKCILCDGSGFVWRGFDPTRDRKPPECECTFAHQKEKLGAPAKIIEPPIEPIPLMKKPLLQFPAKKPFDPND